MTQHILDFLASPDGVVLEHAIVIFILAVLAYLTAWLHRRTKAIQSQLDEHVRQADKVWADVAKRQAE